MKKFGILAITLAVFAAILFLVLSPKEQREKQTTSMILTSPSFQNNELIPKKFTCDDGNINPELHIQNVLENAKSLALIMHDPDAPIPGGFTHWVLWNIDPKTAIIKQESVPSGSVEGMNGRSLGYTGPCPPASPKLQRGEPTGTHRYFFMLYALDTTVSLPTSTTKSDLESAMHGHIIAQTELIGLYKKQGN